MLLAENLRYLIKGEMTLVLTNYDPQLSDPQLQAKYLNLAGGSRENSLKGLGKPIVENGYDGACRSKYWIVFLVETTGNHRRTGNCKLYISLRCMSMSGRGTMYLEEAMSAQNMGLSMPPRNHGRSIPVVVA